MELRTKHWSEKIIEEALEKKKEPYIICSGITTSGSTHLGTLCEFLYPSAIQKGFADRGHKTTFYFYGDILDAFDGVPENLMQFEKSLNPHLGKPLCSVPDPHGCCNSYGEHFLNEAVAIMDELDIHPQVLKANEQYAKGLFDEYARSFTRERERVKEIIEKTSFREIPPTWSPIMIICENCGKISTTHVTDYGDYETISYICEHNVGYAKGCGYSGKTRVSSHKYKLVWRLDWPARQKILGISIEGGGKDHFTKGGSRDTLEGIFREMFREEPSIGYKYGFITIHGKKYSKSKGQGIGVRELLNLVTPELLKYILFKPSVEQDKDIVPTGEFLLKLYDEQARVAKFKPENLTDAEEKMYIAHKLSGGQETDADFSELLIYYQLYRDWNIVKEKLAGKRGIGHLQKYVQNWVEKGILPQNLVCEYKPQKIEAFNKELKQFAEKLEQKQDPLQVHELAYSVILENKLQPKDFFAALYETLIGKKSGPRLGVLIAAIGVSEVKQKLLETYT